MWNFQKESSKNKFKVLKNRKVAMFSSVVYLFIEGYVSCLFI